ncbi:MAG: hypothetical protein H6720_25380 [Sandaracinus sp.]|nr:hypothetical protein [Sandaracinus sp.]
MRVVSLLALLLACGGSTPPVAEPVTPTPGALAASELVEPSELPAALTVVLRPDRWSEVTETVARWIGTDPPGDLRALLSSRPEDLLRLESRRWHLAASELTNLDRSRPVVFRLFEPRIEGLVQVLEVVDGQRLPYRHVILLPSAQPQALLGELRSRITCEEVAEGLQCDRHVITLSAREGEVVVVVDGDGDAIAPRAGFERDATSPLSITLHARAIREVGSGEGARAVHRALQGVDPEYHAQLMSAGLAEIAGAYLRTGPYGRELETVRIAVEPGVGLRFEGRLTEHGAALLTTEGPSTPSAVPSPNAFVTVRSSLPIAAIRERAGLPFGAGNATDPRQIARAFQECGASCVWHALSTPFAHAALMRRATDGEGLEALSVVHDASMPAGQLDVEWDVARMAEVVRDRELAQLAERVPRVYLRSRARGARWVGLLTRDATLPAPTPTGGSAAPSPHVDAASLACLERLGITVASALQTNAGLDEAERATVIGRARADAQTQAACVTDPNLAADRDAWLEWLARY